MRPDKFRFEYTSHHPYPPLRHLTDTQTLWSKDGVTHLYWTARPDVIERAPDVEQAILALAGVSRRSSVYAPMLLLRMPRDVFQGDSWQLLDTARLDKVECHRLSMVSESRQTELWIGSSDYLLRKLDIVNFPDEHLPRIRTEVFYDSIAANQQIAGSEFSFVPPKK